MNPLRLASLPIEALASAWSGHYRAQGQIKDADCVLGFSFGYRGKGKHISPGLSNQDLANVAIKHFSELPKILQFEIADAYEAAEGPHPDRIFRISKHRRPNQYLDTKEVAEQGAALMHQNGWKTAVLLAHPYHMPRVQLVCDKLKISWVATSDELGAVEFDPLSTQKWTRNVDKWRGYEPLAMTYYRMKGWA